MEYGIVTYTRLPQVQKERLDKIAQSEYTTVSSLLRRAVEQYLAARDAAQTPAPTKTKRTTAKQVATAR